MAKRSKQKVYWYFTTTFCCPICCSEDTYKERRYTKKPKCHWDRYKIIYYWDYCGAF